MKKSRIIIVTIILLIIIAITTAYFYMKSRLNLMNYEKISKEDIEITEGIEKKLEKYRNIVLLGRDTRDPYSESGRSDCIIIASINETNKEVKLVSVYRDTYIQIPGHGMDNINNAYYYGGPALSMSTLNTNLDLNISEYVALNFEATKDIVNAVGGVQVTVTDLESRYIDGIYRGGTYNLNGEQALAYSRIRKIDSDYQRTERMRTVLQAVFEKAKKMSPTELLKLVNIVLPEISTNISQGEIISLVPQITQYKVKDSIGWPYNTRCKIINNTWYGPPITLRSNVIQLYEELFECENYEPSEVVNDISQKIVDATGYEE